MPFITHYVLNRRYSPLAHLAITDSIAEAKPEKLLKVDFENERNYSVRCGFLLFNLNVYPEEEFKRREVEQTATTTHDRK